MPDDELRITTVESVFSHKPATDSPRHGSTGGLYVFPLFVKTRAWHMLEDWWISHYPNL